MPELPERRSKRVCVIGGGIAGLVAAYELKKLGHNVTLLESSSRCGGRIYTYRFDADNYGDLGAMRFPINHLCTWKYVNEFGLCTDTFVQSNSNAYYYLRETKFRQGPWKPLEEAHPGLYPNVRAHVGRHSPDEVLDRWIKQLTDKLTPAEQWEAFSPGPLLGRRLRTFDRFSVWQHVKGILPPLRATAPWPLLESALGGAFLRDEEWEYIGRSTSILWDEKTAYLEALVDTVAHEYPWMFRIDGGTEKLIDALKASLAAEIHTDSPVTNITSTSNNVRVQWGKEDQSREADFEYVICAVPAGATARIQFDPALDAAKYEALTNISYQPAAKSLVFCKTRRWETKANIFGGGSCTDMETQECWYPSDNAKPDPQGAPETKRIIYPDGSEGTAKVITEWIAKDPKVSQGPGVLMAAYMWGTNARHFASLTNDERDTLVVRCMENLHPGIKNDILEVKHWSWDNQPNTGGGGWAAFMPGDRGRYQEALVAPHRSSAADDPRVFFAGEHLGICHAWMQGAIQTAQGAVHHVHHA